MRTLVLCGILLAACNRDEPTPPPSPAPAVAKPPIRGAAGDRDLRVMLADVASAKACAMIRDQFRGLRAPDRPQLVTGVLWIRACTIANDGLDVTFHLKGHGWQWAQQTKKKAGGSFEVKQYVRFAVDVAIP